MALRFYRNATAGARDGVLVSSGDETAPIIFDGMYPGVATVSKTLSNIAIRADSGEVWRFVYLTCRGTNAVKFKIDSVNGSTIIGTNRSALIKKVDDTNTLLSINTEASPSDTGSPDTTVDLVAWGVRIS